MPYTVKRALAEFVECFPPGTIPYGYFNFPTEFTDMLIDSVYKLRDFEQEELFLSNLKDGDEYVIPPLLLSKFEDYFTTVDEWSTVYRIISQYWNDLCKQQENKLEKVTIMMLRKLVYMVEDLYELTY